MNTNIKLTSTDQHFSRFGGLKIFNDFWKSLSFSAFLDLPEACNAAKKFEDLSLGFACGAECLDDMHVLAGDSGFAVACSNQVYTPKTYGNYLRRFEDIHVSTMQDKLAELGFATRAKLAGNQKINNMTFDFDSTSNRQYAEKMEGVCFSGEKKYECLTSMYVYDELGIQYYADVRAGNTHTSEKISKIIHSILSKLPSEGSYAAEKLVLPGQKNPYHKKVRIYARADSGYDNQHFKNACLAKGVGFVVRMTANTLTAKRIAQISNWKPTKQKTKRRQIRNGSSVQKDDQIMFYDGRECEIGSTVYTTNDLAGSVRIVCIRAKKSGHIGLYQDDYDYFGFATSIGEHELNDEKIIRFYRARGHAENYIKDAKNGFDLHHYPCLKLNANRAYAIIAAFAYNCLRAIALVDDPKNPHFAKAIRNKLIHLPCQVVRSGREVWFKMSNDLYRRIKIWLEKHNIKQFGLTSAFGSG